MELPGVIQRVQPRGTASVLETVWGDNTFTTTIQTPYAEVLPLLDRHVILRGVAGPVFNSRRQVLGVRMFVPDLRFVQTIGDPPPDLFSTPPQEIQSLLQFSPGRPLGQRLRVRGIVTRANPSGPTWIRDNSGGLLILSHETSDIRSGDLVDVLGSPKSEGYGAVMSSATIRKVRSGLPVPPRSIVSEDALNGSADQQLVQIDGTVVNASVESTDSVVTLRSGTALFAVRIPLNQPGAAERASHLLSGAQVRATGICKVIVGRRFGGMVNPSGFEILAQSPADIIILKNASWFTLGHVAAALAAALVLVFLGAFWIVMLRRRVAAKTHELRAAHEITTRALHSAREAESLEQDRKVILEMLVRDEPLEKIMDAMGRTVARHLPEAECSIELDLPNSEDSALGLDLAAVSSALSATDTPDRLAVAIMRGTERVGSIAARWPAGRQASREQTNILESWGRFAGLAAERRNLYDQLSHRARFDNLTSLHNRASLYERLQSELSDSSATRHNTGIVYLDLDDFKPINDSLGHDTGDMVLREVAGRIRHSIRQTDIAARVGGDEFVVVLPDLRDRTEAENIAALLVSAIREPITFRGGEIQVGASYGISIFPEEGSQVEILLKVADDGMYRAKSRSKSHSRGAAELAIEAPALIA